jgi:glycoside/pentoside/hexuronide:cation symporter, GPH family
VSEQNGTTPAGGRLSWREVLSYCGGSVACNLSWNMVAAYLIIFYTDVAGIPIAAVGTLVLLARIFDAFVDPVAGVVVDRTNTRWGKARPYLVWFAIPFAVLAVLTFLVPSGWSLNGKLFWAYATFGLLGIAYSFLYVPYGAMQPSMTPLASEQLRLSSWRAMGTSIASLLIYSLIPPSIQYFGNAGANPGRGYVMTSLWISLLNAILFFNTVMNCRERAQPPSVSTSTQSLGAAFRALARNRVWLIAMGVEILIFLRLGALVPAMAFMARQVFQSTMMASVLLPVMSLSILTGGFLAPKVLAKLGKRRGIIYSLWFTIACFMTIPFLGHNKVAAVIVLYFAMLSNGIQATAVFAMIAEAVDWEMKRSGMRQEGLLSSSTSLAQKVGFALGSALLAYVLAAVGYKPGVTDPHIGNTLLWLVALVPIFVALSQMACIYWYDREDRVAQSS